MRTFLIALFFVSSCGDSDVELELCEDLQCNSLACGMGDEEGKCTCETPDHVYMTCLASP